MITLRKSEDRGPSNFGWLDSKHTFSFGRYHDPKNMGFGNLRVINDDRVKGGKGFDAHPHNNMEIITYVIKGALEHKDDMGTGSVIKAGDVQHMSTGTGIVHSEFNHSLTEQVHFLQIWIMPKELDIKPQYNQKHFDENEKLNKLVKIISHDGSKNSIGINQDINIFASIINQEVEIKHPLSKEKNYWIHVVKGSVNFQEYKLKEGDGLAITNEDLSEISFQSSSTGEFLLFELSIGKKHES
jgi:hypothetical protein|tara:strand:+ start:2028 stop:2753 length:726 start_codon:yes stop_codon:yes gene_type:complete